MRRFVVVGMLAAAGAAGAAGAADPVRVACVGDSITAGSGTTDRAAESYPAVLQKRLGAGYQVRNFGVGGATLLAGGDKPYVRQKAYQDALAFDPAVVVIKLGTNDTKPQNWKRAAEFEADYKKLVAAFRELPAKPKVYLCTPVPAFPGNFGIDDGRLRTGVRPKVEALGKELGLPVIDLYAALEGKAELFPDKVHPNPAGARAMAEAVHKALTADGK